MHWQLLTAHRYFFLNSETDDVKLQGGAVRTNCMDNLDRTNVAQAAIAKYILTKQLREVGTFGENETVDDHEELSTAFRESGYPLHSPPPSAQIAQIHSGSLGRSCGCHLKGIQWDWCPQDRFHQNWKAHEEGCPRRPLQICRTIPEEQLL